MASKGKSPTTPDYLGAALAQGGLSKDATLSAAGLNRPNEVNPYGSRTWKRTGGSSLPSPEAIAANNTMPAKVDSMPMQQLLQGGLASTGSSPSYNSNSGQTAEAYGRENPTAYSPAVPVASSGTALMPAPKASKGHSISNFSSSIGHKLDIGGKLLNRILPKSFTSEYGGAGPTDAFDRAAGIRSNGGTGSLIAPNPLTQPKAQDPRLTSILNGSSTTTNPGDWTVETTLSPVQQALFDQNNEYKKLSSGLAQKDLNSYNNQDMSGNMQDSLNYSPNTFAANRNATTKAMYDRTTRLYGSQFGRQESGLRDQLVNQGLDENSQAFKTQMGDFRNTQNGAYQDAANNAVMAGGQEQSRMLGDLLHSRSNDLASKQYNLQAHTTTLNNANALASGGQAQVPQFGSYGQAGTAQTPDISGAMSSAYGANLGNVNSQNAAAGQTNSALASMVAAYFMSDRRLKSAIKYLREGFGKLSVYSYIIDGEPSTGYMAQEVQALFPEAVITLPSGLLMLNYNALGGRP